MKIQPVRVAPAVNYPSMAEVRSCSELLKNVPARWDKVPGFAAMLGLLSLAANNRSEAAAYDFSVPAVSLKTDASASPCETEQEIKTVMTVVAPILNEALVHDGRGSFGCVSICPATFMPEDEALDLIRSELEAAGLQLKEGVELQDVPGPIRKEGGAWHKSSEVGLRSLRFDWADEERAIYIDYLARRDYRSWGSRAVSTADSYDFPELAQQVCSAYADYQSDKKIIFGVFFDPLADSGVEHLSLEGLSPEETSIVSREYEKKRTAVRGEKGRERLRAQVRHFVKFLREEGVISDMN